MNAYAKVALYINLIYITAGFIFKIRFSLAETVFLVATIAYLMLSASITDGGYGSVATYFIPFLLYFVFSNFEFSSGAKRFLIILFACNILLLFVYSFPYRTNWENWQQNSVVAINPNTLSMFLLFAFMIISVFFDLKNKKYLISLAVLFVITVFSMYNYRSRGALLTLLCFTGMLFLPKFLYTRKTFLIASIILILLGTAVPFVYLFMYTNGIDLSFLGKSLYTGREDLWKNMFSLFDDPVKVIFGLGSKVNLDGKALNVHNNFFNYIVDFGVIGFIVYYAFVLYQIWKIAKYSDNPIIRKSLIMYICAVIILGFSETTSMWATVFPLAYFGLISANCEYSKTLKKSLTLKKRHDS